MTITPKPEFRSGRRILLAGNMAVYASQREATEKIPAQWREFLSLPGQEIRTCYGASPCTDDGKLHYLCGMEVASYDAVNSPDRLTLEEGEYAVFAVEDIADLRPTWIWALTTWLPSSGRKEKHAPEFERYAGVYNPERVSGTVEIWIPLETQDSH